MRAFLASPIGFLIGLSLGALGGGGSILAVPALVYVAGQDAKSAVATSLFVVGFASLVGLGPHWRAGRVRVGTGLAFGIVGIGGSLLGSALNRRLEPDLLLLGFSGLVVIAAWRMLTGCPTCTQVGEQAALRQPVAHPHPTGIGSVALHSVATLQPRAALTVLAAGSAVGFLTGLFGVGGGFVIVPALTLALKLPMPQAIGTSLLVIAINSAVALSARFATTSIDWKITAPFTVSAVAGVVAGGRISGSLNPKRSLRMFAGLLVAVAAYTAISATIGLA